MNKYLYNILFLFIIVFGDLKAQDIPSLRSLALDKSAELLHQQLVLSKSQSRREAILNKWQAHAGVLLKSCETNQTGTILPSTENTETIIDRFEQKYFQLKEYKSFESYIQAVTPDGKVFITKRNGDLRIDIQVYDVETGNLINTLKTYEDRINQLAITTDNTKAVSVSGGNLIIWDLKTGRVIHKLVHKLTGHTSTIRDLKLTSDNTKAVSVSDGTLIIWDLETGKALHKLLSNKNDFDTIELTADSSKVISTLGNGTFQVWDLITGALINTFNLDNKRFNCFTLVSDNCRVISDSSGDEPLVWDLNTGEIIYKLKDHKKSISGLVVTTDNSKAISLSSDDRTMIVRDLKTGKIINQIKGLSKYHDRLYTLDNDIAITSSWNTSVLWDLKTGKKLQEINSGGSWRITNKKFFVTGNELFKANDLQSIIANMPLRPEIFNTPKLLSTQQPSPQMGIYQAQALKKKNTPLSLKQKIFTVAVYLKNKLKAFSKVS